MVSQRGRPSRAGLEEFLAVHPELVPELSGTGPCVPLNTDGEVIEENIDAFLEIIAAYEAEQQRRCDAVPQCATDEGALAAFVDEEEDLSSDLNHLSVVGQAKLPSSFGQSSWTYSDSRTPPPPPPPCHQPNSNADTSTNPTIGTARSTVVCCAPRICVGGSGRYALTHSHKTTPVFRVPASSLAFKRGVRVRC